MCKINSANYYSNIYSKPSFTVKYDDDVTFVYNEAANLTDWQFLAVTVTPTTVFGQITVALQADTDQLTTSAYVYFDDMSIFYPPGVQLNLGGLDLWADGMPIVPPVSTNINAADVWAYQKSSANVGGSMGELVNTIDTTTKNNQGLILTK